MSIIGLRCERGYKTYEECLECPKRCVIEAPVLDNIRKAAKGYYAPAEHEYHVTSLLGCPRKAVLGRICGEFVPPVNMWHMMMGTLGHDLSERNVRHADITVEHLLRLRFYVNVGNRKVGAMVVGKFDVYDPATKFLQDHKFVWKIDEYVPNPKHFKQMAVYYILATGSGAFSPDEIKGAQINYVDATCGAPYWYQATGSVWEASIAEMREYIPKMLEYYVKSNEDGICPEGDPTKKECGYCPPEFRAYCSQGKGKSEGAVPVLIAIVDKYRKDNTPTDLA